MLDESAVDRGHELIPCVVGELVCTTVVHLFDHIWTFQFGLKLPFGAVSDSDGSSHDEHKVTLLESSMLYHFVI